jgi:hypothetical protein
MFCTTYTPMSWYRYKVANFIVATLQSCYVQTCYITNLLRFKLGTLQNCYKLATAKLATEHKRYKVATAKKLLCYEIQWTATGCSCW